MNYRSAIISILAVAILTVACHAAGPDISKQMKQSILFLNISTSPYNQLQPWKYADIGQRFGAAVAVGDYQVITPAKNVIDAQFIKARRFGQNEFIPAKIILLDYQANLCLLELDKNAAGKPLTPVKFVEDYSKGAELQYYWLPASGDITTGRGYLRKAQVRGTPTSFVSYLHFVLSNTSKRTSIGQPYFNNKKALGIASQANSDNEAALIPAMVINRFLENAKKDNYQSIPVAGFDAKPLLDPAIRRFLKMPDDLKHGTYIEKVHNLGTGSDILKKDDCLLAIDGSTIDAQGRFVHKKFGQILFDHLIAEKNPGENIKLTVWRDGKQIELNTVAKTISPDQMLVPYHEYDKQPEYIITAGFVFQKITRDYLAIWGDDWAGRVKPHLYNYYMNFAFTPTDDRKNIVVLSYVLPADVNLGYQDLRHLVVSKVNGKKISGIKDMLDAMKTNSDPNFHVIEFEQFNPTLVIPIENLDSINTAIAQNYGITKLINVE